MSSNLNSASSSTNSVQDENNFWTGKRNEGGTYGYNIGYQALEAERSDLAGITKSYLDLSTVHGLR